MEKKLTKMKSMTNKIQDILDQRDREFDEKFKGWKTTKFDISQTGEIEHELTSDTPDVVADRQEFKSFLRSALLGLLSEVEGEVEGMKGHLNAMSKTDEKAIEQTKGYRAALDELKKKLNLDEK